MRARFCLVSFLATAGVAAVPQLAAAQDTSMRNQPVVAPKADINGVDITSGQLGTPFPFQFRAPGAGHLNVTTAFNGRRISNSVNIYLDDQTVKRPDTGSIEERHIRVHFGGNDQLFTCNGFGACVQIGKIDGSSLNRSAETSYTFTSADGDTASFFSMSTVPASSTPCEDVDTGCNAAGYNGYAYASAITYANGEKLTYQPLPTANGSTLIYTLSSNTGYSVKFTIPCTNCTVNPSAPGVPWLTFRNGVGLGTTTYQLYAGSTLIGTHTFNETLPSSQAMYISATDQLSRTFNVTLSQVATYGCAQPGSDTVGAIDASSLLPTTIISPGNLTTNVSYKFHETDGPWAIYYRYNSVIPVASVTRGGITWTYNFTDGVNPGTTDTMLTGFDPTGGSVQAVAKHWSAPYDDQYGNSNVCNFDDIGADITSWRDEVSNTQNFVVPTQGAIATSTLAEGDGYNYERDTRGNITRITRTPKSNSTLSPIVTYQASFPASCTHPTSCNRPDWTKDANGGETDYVYDPVHGGVTLETLPAVNGGIHPQKRYSYTTYNTGDGLLYLLGSISQCRTQASCTGTADEIVESFTYYPGTFLRATDTQLDRATGTSLTSNFSYDAAGRLATKLTPRGVTETHLYDAAGREVGVISEDPDGAGPLPRLATRTSYNADDLVTLVETGTAASADAAGLGSMTVYKSIAYTYNRLEQRTKEAMIGADGGAINVTQFSYDNSGRLLCTAVRMNRSSFGSLPSDACVLGGVGSDGADRITHNVYDAAGKIVQIQRAYGVTTANGFPANVQQTYAAYSYSPDGKKLTTTDANGNQALYSYDDFDRLQRWYFPSPSNPGYVNLADYLEYAYDLNGNRTYLRKRDGRSIGFTFDALNRLTSKVVNGTCVTGYICSSAPASALRNVYYAYDLQGNSTQARFDSSTGVDAVTGNFDGFGRLVSSTTSMSGSSRTVYFQYDPDGNRSRITHPDGDYFTYDFDMLDRPTLIKENGSVSIASFAYDPAGRRNIDQRGAVAITYSYDAASRLTGIMDDLAGTSNDVNMSLGYDAANEITTKARNNSAYAFHAYTAATNVYTSNGLNQYQSVGAGSLTYDSNGNLLSNGPNTYTFDVESRLVAVSGNINMTLTYDPLGRLFSPGTGQAIYDGDRLIALYGDNGALAERYVYGPGTNGPLLSYLGADLSARYSLQDDHQGTIISVADSSGSIYHINTFDEYGVPGSGNFGTFQFTGQMYNASLGLYNYKARWYSSRLGRFLQTDPAGYGDQINLYSYVGNNPTTYNDPTGLWTCYECGPHALSLATKFISALQSAAATKGSSVELREVAAKLGNYGDPGVNVGFRTFTGGDLGRQDGQNIYLNPGRIMSDAAQLYKKYHLKMGEAITIIGAAMIGHEVKHVLDDGHYDQADRVYVGEKRAYTVTDEVLQIYQLGWNGFIPGAPGYRAGDEVIGQAVTSCEADLTAAPYGMSAEGAHLKCTNH